MWEQEIEDHGRLFVECGGESLCDAFGLDFEVRGAGFLELFVAGPTHWQAAFCDPEWATGRDGSERGVPAWIDVELDVVMEVERVEVRPCAVCVEVFEYLWLLDSEHVLTDDEVWVAGFESVPCGFLE